MKNLYLPPESESAALFAESLMCQSGVDKGQGAIDLVTESDYNDDVWSAIF